MRLIYELASGLIVWAADEPPVVSFLTPSDEEMRQRGFDPAAHGMVNDAVAVPLHRAIGGVWDAGAGMILPLPPQPIPEMNKRAFRDLAVSVFGFGNWQAAQADPALAEVWDVYASGVTVSHTDVLAFLPGFVALGHATQEQADQLLEEWTHA